jgi:hypothetical protein
MSERNPDLLAQRAALVEWTRTLLVSQVALAGDLARAVETCQDLIALVRALKLPEAAPAVAAPLDLLERDLRARAASLMTMRDASARLIAEAAASCSPTDRTH